MKNKLNLLWALLGTLMLSLALSSCDSNPTESDLFVGTYKGKVSYLDGLKKTISNDNGSVTVTKVGSSYSFFFSDNIPAITGVKFEKKDDNSYISIGAGLTGITISDKNLNMLVGKDGKLWTAKCTR